MSELKFKIFWKFFWEWGWMLMAFFLYILILCIVALIYFHYNPHLFFIRAFVVGCLIGNFIAFPFLMVIFILGYKDYLEDFKDEKEVI